MKISGFTVIRNAELMGYPVCESIRSLLPLVDEFVVGVGQSDDRTKDLITAIGDPKIRIFDSFWDTTKTKGGLILSEKTNEALAHCSHDWCVYLQADEVIHERDLMSLHNSLRRYEKDPKVEGLLFRYLHFYGSYQVLATSRKWYRNEVRAIKKSSGIRSVGDAQSFRVNERKPFVAPAGASVYHYGWVKPPQAMGQKTKLLSHWWHGHQLDHKFDQFQYQRQYGLKRFLGEHPAVMRPLVASQTWDFEPHRTLADWSIKDLNLWASDLFEKVFKYRIGEYKPYLLIDR
jgi:hypothetical protein